MKKLMILFLLFPIAQFTYAQEDYPLSYGFNFSHFYTGSGHGSDFEIGTNVRKGRKSLEMGLIFQDEESKLSGGNVKYKVYLGPDAGMKNEKAGMNLVSYLHYNCIYHRATVERPDFIFPGNKKSSAMINNTKGQVATMEHYAGFGLSLSLYENFNVDGSMGMGAYIGSLDKVESPSSMGIHQENHGFVLAFEFGMGYSF